MVYNKLNEEEEKVISGKGTEAPFTGVYDKLFREGAYLCRRCDSLLYESKDKFDSGCGWPSFDDEVPGAVVLSLDPDGHRTEISCATCDAHLGHVFFGERYTAKDARHCVNSLSLRFVPLDFVDGEKAEAYLAGGCFWCLEAVYEKISGVIDVSSGYAGGQEENPDYDEVSMGNTGHAETVKIVYDPKIIPFHRLLQIFFSIHDPSTLNRQGNDIGPQYRSAVLYKTWRQRQEAVAMIQDLEGQSIYGGPIVTEVRPLIRYYEAEEEHQDYYQKNPDAGYCQAVINPKINKLKKEWSDLITSPTPTE
ncbi:peptide-methionine (S)-S-oxide reductase [Candidatus Falkowbacteria bacterium HGW-Falkowbacteria-2]|uniref:Peptide methionine sulfoxide reductase MsrA n=1 Tax=Candidatus Falkowbacteria bacterium HGW-Falkowbacteria-2 TaxID=2013769 RepID=A0A2N2E3B4_9BACT|nr:MAG: peptide-methionine (S)-S-oxide reductase [Candidatus Falkowbacteria bacterium HGW-Falkowbacteria-2]